METNSVVKSFMIEKILKIDIQNFYISWNVSKSISWTFVGSLHIGTIVKYAFHEIVWKKYFTGILAFAHVNSMEWKYSRKNIKSREMEFLQS